MIVKWFFFFMRFLFFSSFSRILQFCVCICRRRSPKSGDDNFAFPDSTSLDKILNKSNADPLAKPQFSKPSMTTQHHVFAEPTKPVSLIKSYILDLVSRVNYTLYTIHVYIDVCYCCCSL